MTQIILQDLKDKYSRPMLCSNISEALDILISGQYNNAQIIDLKLGMVYQYDEDFELMLEVPLEKYTEEEYIEDEY